MSAATAEQVAQARVLTKVRQHRSFTDEPVSDEDLRELLEVARWSGSGQNRQPWRFIVVRDRDVLAKLGALRPGIGWTADAPLAIALVLDSESAGYDEGRVTERLLIAAKLLGLGAGTVWWGSEENRTAAKALLGVPAEKFFRSAVVIGHPKRMVKQAGAKGGRKPLADIVRFETYDGTSV
jgi:hypothetical protein